MKLRPIYLKLRHPIGFSNKIEMWDYILILEFVHQVMLNMAYTQCMKCLWKYTRDGLPNEDVTI